MLHTGKIIWTVVLAALVVVIHAAGQIGFKQASNAQNLKWAIVWFLGGGAVGTIAMILYVVLLRYIPVYMAYAINYGLGLVLVQLVISKFIFKEPVTVLQWIGGAVVVIGIAMLSLGAAKNPNP
ncbi:EamA family transporter [bacterium]|nr:EamA family transporter [bacterium]